MKNIFVTLFIATGIFSTLTAQQSGNLNFLKEYKDKYGFEVKLFSNTVIKQRLQKLLGAQQFNYLVKSICKLPQTSASKN